MATAKTLATGKCYACGLGVSVAEIDAVMSGNTKHMVLHEEPACAAFLRDEADVYTHKCQLAPIDPLAEAFKDMLK